ncbi:MAG: hypothetical protein GY760_21240 [Deltaproteobacteria bacterium]|nr:hypothetical protein [Deltaproteobacteria bacterium]
MFWTENELDISDGDLYINGSLMPGIFKNQTVNGQVRFDRTKMSGVSGTVKMDMGYDDQTVVITLELLTDDDGTCYEKLSIIYDAFREVDEVFRPLVLPVNNEHLAARGIYMVKFTNFTSQETDQEDVILCTLSFEEYEPLEVKRENMLAAEKKVKTMKEQAEDSKSTNTILVKGL